MCVYEKGILCVQESESIDSPSPSDLLVPAVYKQVFESFVIALKVEIACTWRTNKNKNKQKSVCVDYAALDLYRSTLYFCYNTLSYRGKVYCVRKRWIFKPLVEEHVTPTLRVHSIVLPLLYRLHSPAQQHFSLFLSLFFVAVQLCREYNLCLKYPVIELLCCFLAMRLVLKAFCKLQGATWWKSLRHSPQLMCT